MSIVNGLLKWLGDSPVLDAVEEIDVSQLDQDNNSIGLYKQPSVSTQKLIDGSEIRTENYYLLFWMPVRLRNDRITNEEYLQQVESWIFQQDFNEEYPDIGHPVHSIEMSNAFYMLSRTDGDATYQLTLSITYERRRI